MEHNSIASSTHKSVASKRTTAAATTTQESADQESGWTAYLEDFSNIHQRKSSSSSFSCGSSLISDAATTPSAARKVRNDSHHVFSCSSKGLNKLRLKKTRSKEICEEDSLEDTASSPVNSPKVCNFKSEDMNPREKYEDQILSFLVKGIIASENYLEIRIEEKEKEIKFEDHNDCKELKKVFSFFVNTLTFNLISFLIFMFSL